MGCHIEILNPISYPGWDELVASADGYSFFHSSGWANVLYETYGYRPLYFAAVEGRKLNALLAVMEVRGILGGVRGVSLPFSDYCEPMVGEGVKEDELFSAAIEYGRRHGWQYIEWRGRNRPDLPTMKKYYRHTLDLSIGADAIFGQLKSNVQRNIRKAQREGVEVRICKSPEIMREYYRLHCATRKRHGLPPQPFSFFRNILTHLISRGQGCVLIASHGSKTIAGSVFLSFADKALFKFGASDYAYQQLRAGDLLMWEAIKWYNRNGYKTLSLGRTAIDNSGLRRFKSGWGGEEEIVEYHRYDLRREVFVAGKSQAGEHHAMVFRVMPISLLRLVGRVLYRYMG